MVTPALLTGVFWDLYQRSTDRDAIRENSDNIVHVCKLGI